ncbi:hypothetical protein CCR97_24765 [Rhodoplanes elegans]|uniref:Uncharacterized protein n=1 Tax=Rhodoplanes elegans TaxID=29408 RepID=A0A327K9X5_9BRAD|nr:hypothetical protein [Rhodoplanes elegans]MBK5961393.1 hypothetical protein [Rhodoplanes elegans]RAI34142.1 hypothetical protein CH338_21410 [Rhodoplanes elegans]
MSDPQDGMRDPRLNDPRGIHNPAFADRRVDTPSGGRKSGTTMWAWLAGIVAAVFIIAIVWGMSDRNGSELTMDRNAPAATTGSGAGSAPSPGSGASSVPGATGAGSERSANPGAATPPATPAPAPAR